jgi:hypothetical protein
MRVYISHPYGGDEKNKAKVEKIIKNLIKEYPQHTFVSPIHCFGFMYTAVDYQTGLNWCLDLLDACNEMWVYGDYRNSKGCTEEINRCGATSKIYHIKK